MQSLAKSLQETHTFILIMAMQRHAALRETLLRGRVNLAERYATGGARGAVSDDALANGFGLTPLHAYHADGCTVSQSHLGPPVTPWETRQFVTHPSAELCLN
jgi:hypothetical protein